MGNTPKRPADTTEASAKFEEQELVVLKQTFDHLAARNPSTEQGVDKRTFLRIFNLPGMLGERLFAVFDRKKKEVLDLDDFIAGLSQIVRGNFEDKVKFLFAMYDLNNTGLIERIELTTMLNSAVFAAHSMLDPNFLLSNPDSQINSQSSEDDDAKLRNELKSKVDVMVKSAFEDLAQGGSSLTKDQFREWIIRNPENLEVVEAVFHRNAVAIDDGAEEQDEMKMLSSVDEADADDAHLEPPQTNSLGRSFNKAGRSGSVTPNKQGLPRTVSVGRKLTDSMTKRRSTSADNRKHHTYLDEVFSSFVPESPGGSHPDLSRSFGSTRKKLKPRIYIECHNCGIVLNVFFCYSCGKVLEDDSGSCTSCGVIFKNSKLKYCVTCGFDLNLNEGVVEPPRIRGASLTARKSLFNTIPKGTNTIPSYLEQEHSGYLYSHGTLLTGIKKRWVVLRDNFLYVFKAPKDQKPSGIVFMEGCFVESIDDEKHPKHPFGIEIVFNEEKNKSRIFFAETKEERDDWITVLKQAAQIFDFNDYYEMGPELGTGKFSSVHECTHRVTGKKYAAKVIDKSQLSDKDKESLRTEIAIMQLVNHPNVVHLKNVFEHRHHIYIVMSLVKGGDLFDRLTQRKRFDEYTARSITEKLLKTVQYLHDYGVVHRDLKPENIMVVSPDQDDEIQIADFGLSKLAAPEEVMKLPCGTLAYVAPEVLQMQGYGREVDLWSIGVILYVLLRGKLPFDGKKKSQIISKTIAGKVPFEGDPIWEKVSDQAKDLISKLLQVDPSKRITVSEALVHPWFSITLMKGEKRKSKAKPRRSLPANADLEVKISGGIGDESHQDPERQSISQEQEGGTTSADDVAQSPSAERTRKVIEPVVVPSATDTE